MYKQYIVGVVSGVLALACLFVFGCQVWQLGTESVSWGDVGYPLLLSQLGVLFFGVMAFNSWWNISGGKSGEKITTLLIISLFCELALLLGGASVFMTHQSFTLMNEGEEVPAHITGCKYSDTGDPDDVEYHYSFTTKDGRVIKDSTSFNMSASVELLDGVLVELDANAVHYLRGKAVSVLYMADNPECHTIDNASEMWGPPIVCGMLSILCFALTGYSLSYFVRKERGRIAENN